MGLREGILFGFRARAAPRGLNRSFRNKKYPINRGGIQKFEKSCKNFTGGLDNWEDEVYNNILYHHR